MNRFSIILLLLLLIGLLQYRLWYGDGNVHEFKRLNDRIVELRQQSAKHRERNAALEAEVVDLKQGLDAVEERARHDLGMVKQGEEFVQVIEPNLEPAIGVMPPPEKPEPVSKPRHETRPKTGKQPARKPKALLENPKQADKENQAKLDLGPIRTSLKPEASNPERPKVEFSLRAPANTLGQ